tara:strand:- start:332 stop:1258 length:927 start_codon:yes stop_codon:yes gene_type:complete
MTTKIQAEFLAPGAISDLTQVTAASGDHLLIFDASDNTLKKTLVSTIASGATALDDIATGDASSTLATSSGDIIIDSPDGIVLDADGDGTVSLKDGGTRYALIEKSSDSLLIRADLADGDILFQGKDNTSTITAMSIDMSEAGNVKVNTGNLLLETDGKYIQVSGTSDTFWAMGSSGGVNAPGTASQTLCFHSWNGSAWDQELTLDMSGNLTADGNITAYSDERLKSNIQTLESGLDKVNKLRGVTYTRDEKENIGVIAQEVEKILPEIVLTAEDKMGTKSVDYSRLTAVLIEAVKELSAKLEKLENK